MKYHIPDRVLSEIRFFAEKNGVESVVLFGSRAKGTNTERSDIDIVVYGGDFDAFYWDIHEGVNSLLSFDIINGAEDISEGLEKEIERDGVVIYEKA